MAVCHNSDDSLSLWTIDESHSDFKEGATSFFSTSEAQRPSLIAAPARLAAARQRAFSQYLNSCRVLVLPVDRVAMEYQRQQLARIEPANGWEYLNRTAWNAALGFDREAESDRQKALEREPNNAYFLLAGAAIQLEQTHWRGAVAAQERALEIQNIEDPAAWQGHALPQLESGNNDVW